MRNMHLYRQGEVLLTQISAKEIHSKRLTSKDNVLAHGTTTGHSHVLDKNAQVAVDESGTQYVSILKDSAQLTHQEHTAITVTKGFYKVTIQREHDILNDEIRAVRD